MLANIIETPSDPKFRQVKKSGKKVSEVLVRCKAGEDLLDLVGFVKGKDGESGEVVYRVADSITVAYLKNVKLELQGAYSEFLQNLEENRR